MGGKGKKCRSESPSSPGSSEGSSLPEVLSFEQLDTCRQCPRYNTIVVKGPNEDNGVCLEDIDGLQAELERMLASAFKRKLSFEEGIDNLTNWQDRPAGKHTTKSDKRKALKGLDDDRPLKKAKELSSSASSSSASSVISSVSFKSSKKKNKHLTETKAQDYGYDPTAAVDPMQQAYRNDIPDRFCQFIEAYCAPIRPEHIKVPEDALKAYDEESDLLKVPALGKHYSLKWTSPDEAGKECNKEKKKGLSAANSVSTPDKARNLKRLLAEKAEPEKGAYGPFTQRIISCLVEDSASALNESLDDIDSAIAGKNGNANILFKGLNHTNAVQLEKRLRKELEEQGLLELDDVLGSADLSEDDEILCELKRSQYELKLISSQNQSQLAKLLAEARTDQAKQELRKRLAVTDSEVVEVYRRFLAAKQKKRPLSRKEKEQASKVLRERQELITELDNLKVSAPVSIDTD